MTSATIEGREVELTNPDKLLWPDAGVTKQDLSDAATRLAELQLPHVAGRPATLVRCPDGIDGDCWFQKDVADSLPPGGDALFGIAALVVVASVVLHGLSARPLAGAYAVRLGRVPVDADLPERVDVDRVPLRRGRLDH